MVQKRAEILSLYYESVLNKIAYDNKLIPKETYEKTQERIEKEIGWAERAYAAMGGQALAVGGEVLGLN